LEHLLKTKNQTGNNRNYFPVSIFFTGGKIILTPPPVNHPFYSEMPDRRHNLPAKIKATFRIMQSAFEAPQNINCKNLHPFSILFRQGRIFILFSCQEVMPGCVSIVYWPGAFMLLFSAIPQQEKSFDSID